MKSTIEKTTKPFKYPYLGICYKEKNLDNPLIVLFTDYKIGVSVSGAEIGDLSTVWDEAEFVRYEGTVTLSN